MRSFLNLFNSCLLSIYKKSKRGFKTLILSSRCCEMSERRNKTSFSPHVPQTTANKDIKYLKEQEKLSFNEWLPHTRVAVLHQKYAKYFQKYNTFNFFKVCNIPFYRVVYIQTEILNAILKIIQILYQESNTVLYLRS